MSQIQELLSEVDAILKTNYWLTPINLMEAREKFLKDPSHNPQIEYPEIPIKLLEEKLHTLLKSKEATAHTNLESWILYRKKQEQELTILQLLNRGNEDFGMNSCQLYQCTFDQTYIDQAKIDASSPLPFESKETKTSADIVTGITDYLHSYGITDWTVELSEQTDFYFRVKAAQKKLLIGKIFNWDFTDFDAMLAHEIDGHVIRGVNAEQQANPLLKKPLPFYIKTEEGLASFLGDYCSTAAEINLKHHALKYLAGDIARTGSFKDVYEYLLSGGFTPELAFQRTFRLKRGFSDTEIPGCFGKEALYYEGMLQVKQFLDQGGEVEKLYAAKVGLDDLKYIELPDRILYPERLHRYLTNLAG
jgi:hypothetical protein